MSTEQTITQDRTEVPTHWPPVIHIVALPIRKGKKALCGERIMGLRFPYTAPVTCRRCAELALGGTT